MDHTLYPGKLYGIAARKLTSVYLFLADPIGEGHESWLLYLFLADPLGEGHESWLHALQNKVKYERKVHLRDHPDFMKTVTRQMKEKQGEGAVGTLQIAEGEDEVSIAAHVSAMKEEFKKASPDLILVSDRMDRTLATRMKFIQSNSVKACLEEFPFLRSHEEVLKDFMRITGKDLKHSIVLGLSTYGERIMALARNSKVQELKVCFTVMAKGMEEGPSLTLYVGQHSG
ncbi:unnamed protein product [Darwinula stevensoni]|uniref:Uncharacterized protein n=1 Tax=Darwinula stevensoni TaxID=69355 RepID=A0A7R8X8B3_9CRUS|nr:unnamed protein product [Darwinula stevensoni]CAG0887759.1 unnamed protein product [Darwinula stevensoni]